MNKANEAYIESVKGWLRIQEDNKKRNESVIELTKKQIILDDEVTKQAIINFNIWANENEEDSICIFDIDLTLAPVFNSENKSMNKAIEYDYCR